MTNEQLCSLAREKDKAAEAALIENVLPLIRITAANIQKRYSGILLEMDDLVQEALIGVLRAIKTYDPETGNLFLTYAQAIAENAMLDYMRKCVSAIPASGSILSLDAPPLGFDSEANVSYADIIQDDYSKNPEQLFIRKETITEVRNALGEISGRERAYLHYRYGFVDDMSHDLTETASHFHLSLSRARHTEKAALNNIRRALPGQ